MSEIGVFSDLPTPLTNLGYQRKAEVTLHHQIDAISGASVPNHYFSKLRNRH